MQGGPRVSSLRVASPRMHARSGTLRKIKSACGPGVYLRCSTSGAKHYASVLSCNHPTAPLMFKGIRDCGLEWSVFTRWHTPRICYTLVTRVPVSNTWTGIRFGLKAKFLTLSLLVLENLDLVAVFLQSYTSDKKCFCEF